MPQSTGWSVYDPTEESGWSTYDPSNDITVGDSYQLKPSQYSSFLPPPPPPEPTMWDTIGNMNIPLGMFGSVTPNQVGRTASQFGTDLYNTGKGLIDYAGGDVKNAQNAMNMLEQDPNKFQQTQNQIMQQAGSAWKNPFQVGNAMATALDPTGLYMGASSNLEGIYRNAAAGNPGAAMSQAALLALLGHGVAGEIPKAEPFTGQGTLPGMKNADFGARMPEPTLPVRPPTGQGAFDFMNDPSLNQHVQPPDLAGITRNIPNAPLPPDSMLSPEFFQAQREATRTGNPFQQPEVSYPAGSPNPVFPEMSDVQGQIPFDMFRRNGKNVNLRDLQNQDPNAFGGILGPEVGQIPQQPIPDVQGNLPFDQFTNNGQTVNLQDMQNLPPDAFSGKPRQGGWDFGPAPTLADMANLGPHRMWPDTNPPAPPPPPTTGGMWPDLTARTEPPVTAPAPPAAPTAPPPTAGIPFMITRDMRAKLQALGIPDDMINDLTPEGARAIIESNTPKAAATTEPLPIEDRLKQMVDEAKSGQPRQTNSVFEQKMRAQQAAAGPKLPRDLSGAKPRYQDRQLEFSNDLDKALYIIAQEKKSARHADYLQFVQQHTGLGEYAAEAVGRAVKAEIKTQVAGAEPGTVQLPSIYENLAVTKKFMSDAGVAALQAAPPTDTPTEVTATMPSTEPALPQVEGVRFTDPDTAVMYGATGKTMDQLKQLGFISTKEIVPSKPGEPGGVKFVRDTLGETPYVQAAKAKMSGATTGYRGILKTNKVGELEVPVGRMGRILNAGLEKNGWQYDRTVGDTAFYKRKPLPNDAGVIDFTSRKEHLRRAQELADSIPPEEPPVQEPPATRNEPPADYRTVALIQQVTDPNQLFVDAGYWSNKSIELRKQGNMDEAQFARYISEVASKRYKELTGRSEILAPTEREMDHMEIQNVTTKKQASDLVQFWTQEGANFARSGDIEAARHAAQMRDAAMNKAFSMPDTPDPENLTNQTAQDWASRVVELDTRKAPDTAYRDIMSTAGKNPLKSGETWRGRVLAGIDYFEGKTKGALRLVKNMMNSDDTGGVGPVGDSIDGLIKKFKAGEFDDANPTEKKSYARKMWDLIRSNPAMGDLSAALKQGSALWYTHQWRTAFGKMVEAMGSEEAAKTIMDEIKSRDIFQGGWSDATGGPVKSFAKQIGFRLSELDEPTKGLREEQSGGEWSETGQMFGEDNIVQRGYQKTVGRYARATNRAYNVMLNSLRADTLQIFLDETRKLYESDQALGGKGNVPDPYSDLVHSKQLVDAVNTLTGRGPLKLDIPTWYTEKTGFTGKTINAESISKVVSNLLFSPRLFASRVRMLNPGTYMMAPKYVRLQYLKGATAMAALWGGGLTLSHFAFGAKVQTDPRSADWMKARWGNTRLDMGQGLQQQLVLLARFISGYTRSSASNKLSEIGAGYKADTEWDLIERYLSNKAHPGIKFGYDWFNRSERQPFSVGDRALQLFLPMIAGDMLELAKEDPKMIPGMVAPITLGMGSQIYSMGQTQNKFIGKGAPLGPGGLLQKYMGIPYGIPDKQFVGGGWGQAPVKRKGL